MMLKKSITLLLLLMIFVSCKELSRNNPTDPESPDYIGIHYDNARGDFSHIKDFTFLGSDIYVVDSGSNSIDILRSDDSKSTILGGYTSPASICTVGDELYMTDNNTSIIQISFSPALAMTSYSDFNHNLDIISSDGTNVFVSDNTANSIHAYAISALTASNLSTPSNAWDPGGIIRDIECAGGSVFVALQNGDIKRYSPNGTPQTPVISVGKEIHGIEIKGDTLYVPTSSGVFEYSITSGNKTDTWGDFGEGSGLINQPALIELHNNDVYIEDNTYFKVFIP